MRIIRLIIAFIAALFAGAACSSSVDSPPPSSSGAPSSAVPSSETSSASLSAGSSSPAPLPSVGASSAGGSSTADAATSAPSVALRELAALAVKGRAPKTGYDRAEFGQAWSDDTDDVYGHNGCDTRNDVLRRDLTSIVVRPDTHGCVVLRGTLADPYTGDTIAFTRGRGTSSRVQIDHVVALSDAWQKGAQQWTAARRLAFANDPLELLAVDGPANESKGDGDTATWLPPNQAYRCAYVARQVAVKTRYHLWVTSAEHDAMAGVLSHCG